MQRLALIIGMVIVLLGLAASPAKAADPIGPFCLRFDAFIETFELFLMPSGGENYVLSGHNRRDGKPLVGSARLTEVGFLFYFLTGTFSPLGNQPGVVFDGGLNPTAKIGTARYFFLNQGPPTPGSNNTVVQVIPCV